MNNLDEVEKCAVCTRAKYFNALSSYSREKKGFSSAEIKPFLIEWMCGVRCVDAVKRIRAHFSMLFWCWNVEVEVSTHQFVWSQWSRQTPQSWARKRSWINSKFKVFPTWAKLSSPIATSSHSLPTNFTVVAHLIWLGETINLNERCHPFACRRWSSCRNGCQLRLEKTFSFLTRN